MKVHPTAIIGDKVKLAQGVQVGPYAVIDGEVSIGEGTKVLAHATITGFTDIGKNCEIHMNTVLGHVPQDMSFDRENRTYLKIGDNNVFREYTSVHRGTKPESETVIGNNNYFMGTAHIAHNCRIGNNVIFVNNTQLAGYVEIDDNAFLSGNIIIHQFCRIGCYAMISGLSGLNQDVPPYMMAGGRPAVVTNLNVVGLRRGGFSIEQRKNIKKVHTILFREDRSIKNALEEIDSLEKTKEIETLISFIKNSSRGICSSSKKKKHGQSFE